MPCLALRHPRPRPLLPPQIDESFLATNQQPTNRPTAAIQSGISLIGIALFFLQTFRTNSAYTRWYEGRTLWVRNSPFLILDNNTYRICSVLERVCNGGSCMG
jgi:hypothetical protein